MSLAPLAHVYLMLSVAFLALSMNWMADNQWDHATATAALAAVAYIASDRIRRTT